MDGAVRAGERASAEVLRLALAPSGISSSWDGSARSPPPMRGSSPNRRLPVGTPVVAGWSNLVTGGRRWHGPAWTSGTARGTRATGPPCSRTTRSPSGGCGPSTHRVVRRPTRWAGASRPRSTGCAASSGADTSNPFWSNCQHGSWYFLPWHRMYLAAFELIIQHSLDNEEWSLPYWYSIDPDDVDKSALPPAFLDRSSADEQPADRRAVADRAVRWALLRRHPGRLPELLAARRVAVRPLHHPGRGLDVRGRRAQRPELQRRRGRAARGRAARAGALAGRQRLRRQHARQPGLDGLVLHRGARPDLLAAPREPRPVVAGLAGAWTTPTATRRTTRPSWTRSSPSRIPPRGP